MSGSFTLLEFAPGVSSPIAYQEYAVGGHIVDDPDVCYPGGAVRLRSVDTGRVDCDGSIKLLSDCPRLTGAACIGRHELFDGDPRCFLRTWRRPRCCGRVRQRS